jgi:hypothetical protein
VTPRVMALGFAMLVALAAAAAARPDGDATKATKPAPPAIPKAARPGSVPAFTPEREAAALTFVRRHHKELVKLLERLKPMDRDEYERAIGELFQVSETLANLRLRDEKRYEVSLDAWKAKSKVELLVAQLAGNPKPELQSQLRDAIEAQVGVEIRQQKLEREAAEARLRKANEAIERLESNRGNLVDSRVNVLLKKAERARRQGEGDGPSRPAKTNKGESKK